MNKTLTVIEKTTQAIATPFSAMTITTKEDTERYMAYANTLVDVADFAIAYILKLTRDNVFNHKLKDLIPYAETAFSLKKSSVAAKVKFADEFLTDATKTKLIAYYRDGKYVTFADNENEQPDLTDCELKDFTYSQINVIIAKGITEIRNAIVNGKISPYMSTRAIKAAFDEIPATFTDNTDETTAEPEEEKQAEPKKNDVPKYIDTKGVAHTFDEINACNTDELVMYKQDGEKAYTVKIKLADIKDGNVNAKMTIYTIQK